MRILAQQVMTPLDTVEAVSTEISTNSERIYFYAFVVCNDFGEGELSNVESMK